MRIGQILFSQLSSRPAKDYKNTGRYHGRDWQHFVDPKEEEIKRELKAKKE
jgi:deoxycytidine triphosphate deaminase